jgi:hypothetical protein
MSSACCGSIIMEVKTRHSFRVFGCTGQLSLASHRAEWVAATDARDPPLFVVSGTSLGLGDEKAYVHSLPLINSGAGFEPPLWLSPVT